MTAAQETFMDRFSIQVFVWFKGGHVCKISPHGGLFVHACIHPFGDGAVFWGARTGYPRIWRHAFDSSAPAPLTAADYSALQPSFDSQGERVVFLSDRDSGQPKMSMAQRSRGWETHTYTQQGYLNIYTMRGDGGDVHRVTRGAYLDFRPALSPDGSTIAFLSDRSGQPYRLHTVPADGSSEPRLMIESTWAGRPWYSMDGKWIYFFTDVGEHRRICRIPADGGDWEPVTPEGYPRSHGTFCDPDGQHLWFHSSHGDATRIYRYSLDGGGLEQVEIPGYANAAHVTRDRMGSMTFDKQYRSTPPGIQKP